MSLERRYIGLEIHKDEVTRRHEECGRAFPYTRELVVHLMLEAMNQMCDSLTNKDILDMCEETTRMSIDLYPIKEPQ
jgi:hypothetical protein